MPEPAGSPGKPKRLLAIVGVVALVAVGVVVWLVAGEDSGSDSSSTTVSSSIADSAPDSTDDTTGDSTPDSTATTETVPDTQPVVDRIDPAAALDGLAHLTDGLTEEPEVSDTCPLVSLDVAQDAVVGIDLSVFADSTDLSFLAAGTAGLDAIISCTRGDQSGTSGVELGVAVIAGDTRDVVRLQLTTHDGAEWTQQGEANFGGGRLRSACVEGAGETIKECMSWWQSDTLVVIVNVRTVDANVRTTRKALRALVPQVVAALADHA